jgi:hypothetical protein
MRALRVWMTNNDADLNMIALLRLLYSFARSQDGNMPGECNSSSISPESPELCKLVERFVHEFECA